MSDTEKQVILEDIKNYLDITFTDYALDKKLVGIMERGAVYLSSIAGADLNFITENMERQLLMDYCRYANANCIEEFKHNFGPELLTLRIGRAVEDYAK